MLINNVAEILDEAAGTRVLSLDETLALMRPATGPQDPIPTHAEVAVIGAGPVGLTAALLLAHYGIDTVLIEKNEKTTGSPRAIAIDDEYMRLLHRMGLGSHMRVHTSKPFGIHFISPFGLRLVRVPGFITPNGQGNRNAVLQPVFEKILLGGLRAAPSARIHFGSELVEFHQSDEEVTLSVKDKAATQELKVQYLLGCDGARSYVRSALQISFEGKRIDAPHLVVDLAAFPDQAMHSRFFCNPSRPLNSIPGPYGGRRLEFMLNRHDDHDEIITDTAIQRLVDKHSPYAGVKLNIIRRAIYGFSERIAGRLRVDRTFLLGDAAHVMPPFGGQGMNSGARDASNLAWKIAGVLRGRLNPQILNTYDGERLPHIRQIVKYSVWIGKLANMRFWPLALARDVILSFLNLFPPGERYFSSMRYMPRPGFKTGFVDLGQGKDALIGRMFPLLRVLDEAERPVTLDDIADRSFVILGFGVHPRMLKMLYAKSSLSSLEAKLVSLSEAPSDVEAGVIGARPADDNCQSMLASRIGQIAVIRPDGYVACMASSGSFVAASKDLNRYTTSSDKDVGYGAM